tara:strand:+ start:253 stop:390 length:138 start_codon:yes stop_codon:yes gene_type:complete
MKKNKDTKAKKPSDKKTASKEETKDEQNNRGGIPDMDFKKLLGCG